MKKYFFVGLISLLPITLTLMIIFWLFDFFTAPFWKIMENAVITYEKSHGLCVENHETLVIFISRLLSLFFLFFLILLLGFLGRKYFFKTGMRWLNLLFSRIPFVKTVYRISNEITKAVFTQGEKTFKKTILVPFPTRDSYSIGFLTGEIPEGLKKAALKIDCSIFVPTAPHPLSGYMLLTAKEDLVEVDVSVEEAFKFLVSCGMIHPGQTPPKEDSQEELKR